MKYVQPPLNDSEHVSDINHNSNLNNPAMIQQPYQTAQFTQGFSKMDDQQVLQKTQDSTNELLTITIEIGPEQNETILIKEGDKPDDLAREFAHKHGISQELRELLSE